MRLANELLTIASERLDAVAWVERDLNSNLVRSWSWSEIKELTASTAKFLAEHSIGQGDRIVNLGQNSLAWAILDLACSALNAVHVPIDSRFSPAQQRNCIVQIDPKLVFSDTLPTGQVQDLSQLRSLPRVPEQLEQLVRPFHPNDLANILFTSGTTSSPRGVMLSHRNLIANAQAKLDAMPQNHNDYRLNFLPFSHAYARTCELTTWLMSHSCIEIATGIDGALNLAAIAKPTLINGVPVFYDRLAAKWHRMGSTKTALNNILGSRISRLASGGATISNAIRARFAAVDLPIFQGYGLTESSPVICSNRVGVASETPRLIEVGPPVKGVEIRIDSDSRLWVSGDGVMLGYWQDLSATRTKLVDNWLDTGDLAEVVSDENTASGKASIRILGRADDTIVLSNGYKVQPFPIEQILNSQPWVSQCLLVGMNCPHTVLLLRPNACSATCLAPSNLLGEIEKLLTNFPKHAIPKKLVLVDEDWTSENGMCNFKGGLNRKRIELLFRTEIKNLLTANVP